MLTCSPHTHSLACLLARSLALPSPPPIPTPPSPKVWLKRILPSNEGDQLYEYGHGNGYGYTGGYSRSHHNGFGEWYGDGLRRLYYNTPTRERGLVSPHSNVADFLLDYDTR